jgi:hypothetical protein
MRSAIAGYRKTCLETGSHLEKSQPGYPVALPS